MRPLDFHRLGLRLAQDAVTEAQQRIAVTCLYYGLHHKIPWVPLQYHLFCPAL